MTECTVMFPTRVLLSSPGTSTPAEDTQVMSGVAISEAGFVRAHVIEFELPTMPEPSPNVDILTEEVETVYSNNNN